MGDFRFSLKAKFSMGDVQEEKDFNLNYSPRDSNLDHRIEEWLAGCFERGLRKRFARHREHGEWFFFHDDIRDFLKGYGIERKPQREIVL